MSSKDSKSGVDNTARRKWDRDEFATKAAEREREEEELELAKTRPPPSTAIVQRAPLKQRGYEVDLTSRLGKTQVVTEATPLQHQAGYYCNVCECMVKDSANFLDHINGKKHQRALGMSMRVERATLDQVRNRFETNKRKMEQKATEDDYETRLLRLQEEEEELKRERKERKKQKKLEAEKEKQAAEADVDPEMAAFMGFSGFGGGK
uniref:U1-type domain-containing protein n=1 Tax=Pyramimonas obovata TaxID=1411642 RepID=A0A7S0RB68_9CHLO|mmetsp:Transcript_29813/g.65151  ORF Transcript_29813/g.65151 Transcript_29813/m.65151 type:complete len:207 (+) Transcript_29813:128-748(+)|eukprot:CAMPEP_0118921766 /NCGR_PEP_ID=MMETSP1169-20130426/940_1 /TAXON_ID=36882 /ORGANISM="Pyramimonas obovata, Strain CCMP722" /LENGTH=206 /DNA_ID=CAMNT_0006862545 /DNA_START=128 /DNA_END=748 /DNA_ORIENTATION=+